MIKIKLTESRTLPVPEDIVKKITKVYRAGFIRLVIDFIIKKISNKKLKPSIKEKYKDLLQQIQQKYANELADSKSIGFVNDLSVDTTIKNGELVESIPVEEFIMALLSWNELDTYLRDRMQPEEFKERLKHYFEDKGVDDIQFNMEFGSRGTTTKKDYAGLYKSNIDAIDITFNASFFTSTQTDGGEAAPGLSVGSRSIDAILDNIDTELEDTGTSVRHEIQHLFQNTMSNILGTGEWQVGLPPKNVLNKTSSGDEETPHHLQSIEMQTDLQDEVDKFLSYVKKFEEKNPDKSAILPQVVKIFIKLFIDSKLTNEENKFATDNNLKIYVLPSELLRTIKTSKNKELYNYASKLLYNSIREQIPSIDPLTIDISKRYGRDLQENIIMDKIKIILKESSLINEELSKDELRKIIRDEFEKLLKDKENRKEIAKITKEFVKKFYRELSFSSTHIIDQVDI